MHSTNGQAVRRKIIAISISVMNLGESAPKGNGLSSSREEAATELKLRHPAPAAQFCCPGLVYAPQCNLARGEIKTGLSCCRIR